MGFQARRITASYEERIQASPLAAFELACPIREYDWIDGWQSEWVYSESGVVEDDAIFREPMSGALLDDPELITTWIITLREPETGRFHATLLFGDLAVAKFEYEVGPRGEGGADCRWDYVLTSLSEEGNQALANVDEARIRTVLMFLAKSAKHYLETGECLTRANFLLMLAKKPGNETPAATPPC